MDANTQQVSEFEIRLNPDTSITPHQVYEACKPFGVIVECSQGFDSLCIKFDRSIHTDRLKPNHQLRINNEEVDLKWLHDENCPLQQSLELESNQQSPQNILDALNDDCLREIFVNVSKFDRCAVAHVCQRFRDVVLAIKPKHIYINDAFCTHPLWKIERFFRIFGKSIQTVHITECPFRDIVLMFLSKYCENLEELDCAPYVESTTVNEVAALFPRLRSVFLRHRGTADIVFQPNDQIESIRVCAVAHLPPIHFPKLRELQLRIGEADVPSIKGFFALNSQIEILKLEYENDFSMLIILENLPWLQVLRINWCDDIRALCQARHLHTLEFTDIGGDVAPVLRACMENGIQLKRLQLFTERFDYYSYDIDLLMQMKSLEHLAIDCLNDDQLVRLVGKLPTLKTIEMDSTNITPRGIRDAMRCANSLKDLEFNIMADTDERMSQAVDQIDLIEEIGEMCAKRSINVRVTLLMQVKTGGSVEDMCPLKNVLVRVFGRKLTIIYIHYVYHRRSDDND